MKAYALYRGEELLAIGTIREIATELKIKEGTVRFYQTPRYKRRLESRKNGKFEKQRSLVNLEGEE